MWVYRSCKSELYHHGVKGMKWKDKKKPTAEELLAAKQAADYAANNSDRH